VPFCLSAVKLIDLGAWAAEEHAIAGNPLKTICSLANCRRANIDIRPVWPPVTKL
jgi:endogenous inhibitor of DNA gyrase (YacG/DUF329 family)